MGKWLIVLGLLMMQVLGISAKCWASTQTDYETAKLEYTAAWLSLAAYDDRLSQTAQKALRNYGWTVEPVVAVSEDAKAHYVRAAQGDMTLLAVAGTANWGDVKADLNIHTVPFHQDTPDDGIKTHMGFTAYTDAVLQDEKTLGSTHNLVLTGHSLGGAVATLIAARLADTNANPVSVVTFGAPSVGNATFVQTYEPKLQLYPIAIGGDPVPTVLQSLSAAYEPFTKKMIWQQNPNFQRVHHDMVVYVDSALRQYYDAKAAYVASLGHDVPLTITPSKEASIYILPMDVTLPEEIADDAPYMQDSADDILRYRFHGIVWADHAQSLARALVAARRAGKQYVYVRRVTGAKVKTEPYEFTLSLTQTLYDSQTGAVVKASKSVTNTSSMTPIETVLYMLTNTDIW